MKLLFKQRIFSWFDSYDIYDEQGNVVFVVKGQLSWGHCLQIYDGAGNHLGTVKEEIFTFLPKFRMFMGEQYIGEIKKELTFLKPRYYLDFKDWQVDGDFLEWNYMVTDGAGFAIMTASKAIMNFSDTYQIEVGKAEDVLCSLMIVLAIDAAKCSKNS